MATLHKKTLSIIGATLIGMIIFIYLSSHLIILDSFDRLEEQDAIKNAICVENILLSESKELENKAADWSVWDETYNFVQGNDDRFVEKYLMDYTFLNQELDFMLFYNDTGTQVFRKVLANGNDNQPYITELEEHIAKNEFLLEHPNTTSRKTGFLVFSDKPILLTSQPVVRSDLTGPIAGTVIMGRIIDDGEISELHELTDMELNIENIRNYNITDNSLDQRDTGHHIDVIDEGVHIYSYASFNDIYDNKAFSIKVGMLRSIHQQGVNTINYFLIILLLTGIIFGTSVTALLERSHISRLKRLQNEIKDIGEKGDFSKRVRSQGNDEVASLGGSINKMLESLESSQDLIVKRDTTINAILQAMPDMMFLIKKDGSIRNYKLSTDKCIYESPEEELDIRLDDILPAHIAEKEREIIEQALRTNKMQIMQYTMPVKGEMRDFELRLVVSGEDEVMAVIKDITEIKQAEEMRRKDLLLKEIHHRVKNNLQIISSLLRLQSRKFTDKETVEAFRKSQNRAKSMAIAHEKMYQSSDLENIELENYVETLTRYLLNNYGCDPENIKIDLKIKNLTQGIDTAIPLGLIITEIVSNALKHAFKDHKGNITIEISPQDNGYYLLVIRDNGVGFPEDIDFMNTDSLGMRLVISLVDQIEGTIELVRDNGTEFRIRFKEISYKRRDY
ncbi:CHASE4 domain-containing protein [Methanolobus profundi]|uniref:histidine kinase n=1 Tax=Methanolobus profundi TaxID=487685 RepID=A0A1I4S052_9EURY|nr:CHASE4 domain-containing protein [Methanolobus profundi]SFM57942.1 PAS domain S-box-containing protein [Methanolobus profundi]